MQQYIFSSLNNIANFLRNIPTNYHPRRNAPSSPLKSYQSQKYRQRPSNRVIKQTHDVSHATNLPSDQHPELS